MAWRITWSPTARMDLKGIFEYISEDNPTAAHHFVSGLIAAIENLAEFPKSGRVVPEFREDTIRELIHRPYRLVYRLDETAKSLEVVRLWHAARGIPEL